MPQDDTSGNDRSFSQGSLSGPAQWDGSVEIIALSAGTKSCLAEKLRDFVASRSPNSRSLDPIARQSREAYNPDDAYRLLIVIQPEEKESEIYDTAFSRLAATETAAAGGSVFLGENNKPDGGLAFIFPGQGSQYVDMGADLIKCFPEAEAVLASADHLFDAEKDLRRHIYPPAGEEVNEKKRFEETLRSTDVAQPAIGAISLGMVQVLNRFKVRPDATAGHSFGELTALCSAGRIDAETFLSLAVARGKFMSDAGGSDKGRMLAVKAPLEKIDAIIDENGIDAILANRNSPDQGVVSGSSKAIDEMKALCRKNRIRAMELPVSAAFHSRLVENAAAPFAALLQNVHFSESQVPVFSNTTGMPYPPDEKGARKMLENHLLNPVFFMDEINRMHQYGIRTFLEVGPKAVLTGLVKAILKDVPFHALSVDASTGRRSGLADLAHVLCTLSGLGYPVDIRKWGE